jgi:hypothetical protein
MKKVLPLLLFFLMGQLNAQVGINTTAPAAQLDIRSVNQAAPSSQDGLLIPKIDIFPAINPAAAQNGMLVFLTTAAGANLPGFYYWDNATTSWKGVANDNTKWGLTGNAGTTPATHFIGTSDAQDVIFKRQNIKAGQLNTANTSFGVNSMFAPTGTNNTAFGSLSLQNDTSGAGNTAVGNTALGNTTIGNENTAVGHSALAANTQGSENVIVGSNALAINGSGSGNTAIGYSTLSSLIGAGTFGNIAIGHRAGGNMLNGNNNIFIGTNTNAPTNNISNQLNIGNTIFGSTGATKNIGINTNAPKGMLDVTSTNNGVLIPRVALTSAILQAPIINPQGGAAVESTLVYNTATAGTAPNDVRPGFYYWNNKWVRFDVDQENIPKYYTAEGTSSVSASAAMVLMPDMEITYTPVNATALVHFSAAGFLGTATGCGNFAIFFQVLVNGVVVKGWQTSLEDIGNATNRTPWDTSFTAPVAVTPGIPQTIAVFWSFPGCPGGAINLVANPTAVVSGQVFRAHRSITVIDPNGGGGIVAATPPVVTNNWSVLGNTGTNPNTHFIGTADNADVTIKRNGLPAGKIGLTNTALGNTAFFSNAGLSNSAFGNSTLVSNTGAENTAIGSQALQTNTSGAGNTAVGKAALLTNLTGSDNTAIGHNAKGGFSDLINATAIGANTFVETDNALVLGSIAGVNTATVNVNVGIGTTIPQSALHISRGTSGATPHANSNLTIEDDAANYQHFLTPATVESGLLFGTPVGQIRSAIIFNNPVNPDGFLFRAGGNNNRLAITGVGEVGIGTIAPNTDLEVSGGAERTIRVSSTTGGSVNLDFFRSGVASGDWRIRNVGGELVMLRSDDDFATAPDEQFRMSITSFRPIDNTKTLGTAAAKWISVFATNGTIQTSDLNDKQNISKIESGLEKIMRLEPVSFQWKEQRIDNYSQHLGFIAQQVQKVLPAVVVDSDWVEHGEGNAPIWQKSEKLGMKYAEIIPVLVKAVQEQQQTIETQSRQLSKLAEDNKKLQQQLETHDRQLQQILNRLSPDK